MLIRSGRRPKPIIVLTNTDLGGDGSQRWTVPLGGGIGRFLHLGKLPVNTRLGAYHNVVRPDIGAEWQLRL